MDGVGAFLRSKTRVPSFDGLLPRPQLQELISQALRRPLVLVSAPAGYGKTWALAEMARTGPEVAWFSLDSGDNDPVRFWSGVALSCQAALGGPETPWKALLEASQNLATTPGELADLAATALDQKATPALLVWDDFHELKNPALLDSLAAFLVALPSQARVVLSCRVDPPLPLSKWRLQGRLGEIRASALRFSDPEGRALLQDWGKGPWEAFLQENLLERLEGWPAGLRLAALSLAQAPDPEAFLRGFSGGHQMVLEYLTEEVLLRQTEPVREFLLVSAVFDRWCPELLDAVKETREPAEALTRQIEAAGLFLVPLDGEGRWFRYHHLFSETLRARLRMVSPGRERRLQATAALWFEEQGDIETALECWTRAGDLDQGARCLGRVDFLARGQLATLAAHLETLGEPVLRRHPRLADQWAWVKFFQGHREEAFAHATAVGTWSVDWSPEDRRRSAGSAAALRAFDAVFRGQIDRAVEEAQRADQELAPEDYYPRSILPYVLGTHFRELGNLEEADRQFGRITEIGEALGSIWTISQGYYEQGVLAYHRGNLHRALERTEVALARADQRGAGTYGTLGRIRALQATLLFEQGRGEEATSILGPLIGNRTTGLSLATLEALAVQIEIELAQNRDPKALMADLLTRARRGRTLPRITAQIAGLQLLTGDAQDRPGPSGEVLGDLQSSWAWARCCLFRGDDTQALEVAQELHHRAQAGWGLWAVRAGVLIAWIHHRLGRDQEASAWLTPSLEEARRRGLVQSLKTLGPSFLEWAQRPSAASKPEIPASPREREVLLHLAQGLSNREIADRLFISEATVKTHLHHLATRWGASNRHALLVRARKEGLVPR